MVIRNIGFRSGVGFGYTNLTMRIWFVTFFSPLPLPINKKTLISYTRGQVFRIAPLLGPRSEDRCLRSPLVSINRNERISTW